MFIKGKKEEESKITVGKDAFNSLLLFYRLVVLREQFVCWCINQRDNMYVGDGKMFPLGILFACSPIVFISIL